MNEKVKYKLKDSVGKRQHYRRVALTVQQILQKSENKSTSIPEFFNQDVSLDHTNKQVNKSVVPCLTYASNNISHEQFLEGLEIQINNLNIYRVEQTPLPNNILHTFLEQCNTINYNADNSNCDDKKTHLVSKLKQWAISHNIPHSAVRDILRILHSYHVELPMDSRTLLGTPRYTNILQLDNGEFCYFGLKNVLNHQISENRTIFADKIEISFNIDGLPLFTSCSTQLWPILGQIKNFKSKPFVVGVFCGKSKPKPLNLFLRDFVDELYCLLQEGFEFETQKYEIIIHSFICDAPARAFVKCIKMHNGYSSCEKCVEPGEYVKGRIIFKSTSASTRTDTTFILQQDEDHHTGISPLLKLQIGMVTCFPIDYMHACCLGVMRKLLNFWLCGSLPTRINGSVVKILSDHLVFLAPYIPSEFNRKPRKLEELPRWKATEFRLFLLYLGPYVLKGRVRMAVYEHFLLFHFAISILIGDKHILKFGCKVPNELLIMFVKHCEKLYGKQFLVYNVHILCHLACDVEHYGSLDSFSAFSFENYLAQLKRLIKSPTNCLQQICRRLHEMSFVKNEATPINPNLTYVLEHNFGPVPAIYKNVTFKQFRKLALTDFILSTYSYSKADCYCLFKDNVLVQIHNFIKTLHNTFIIGKQFNSYSSLYVYPFDSKELNIYVCKKLSNELQIWPINEIVTKCIAFPSQDDDSWICFPLIHTF